VLKRQKEIEKAEEEEKAAAHSRAVEADDPIADDTELDSPFGGQRRRKVPKLHLTEVRRFADASAQ
jgi:hypothetical protein